MTKFDKRQFMREVWKNPESREKMLEAKRRYWDKEMKRRILAALRRNEK
jgi:hypothetical protein